MNETRDQGHLGNGGAALQSGGVPSAAPTPAVPSDAAHVLNAEFANRWTHTATTVTVITGLVPLAWLDVGLSSSEIGWTLALGACLLVVMTFGAHRAARAAPPSHAMPIYFSLVSALVVPLVLVSQSFAWICLMPIVSQAVLFGSVLRGVLASVALTVLAGIPFRHESPAEIAGHLVGTLGASAFVVGFSLVARREVYWRHRAESLSTSLATANRELEAHSRDVAELTAKLERTRLAREVHDSLGHYLTAIHVQLEAAGALLPRETERAGESVRRARQLAKEGLDDVRSAVAAMRNPSADERTLPEQLGELVSLVTSDEPKVSLVVTGDERPLPAPVCHALERVAREGLTNSLRHASARSVELRLCYLESVVRLSVVDDGRGAAEQARDGGGFGLVGIRERIEILGGHARFGAGDERGFSLAVEVPA